MTRPLEGLRVVSLEQAVAAPFCTSRLADAGAEVIKVERVEGDFARGYDHDVLGLSAYFVWLNRGKQSVVLDFKNTDDATLLLEIIAQSDVFIQNLAPGAAARSGFGSAELRAAHPRLITCDISGYGETGPRRDMKAYDLLVQCESGLTSITGTPDGPGRVGVSVCDIACGMYAHAAILEALIARSQTGVGQALHLSLFQSMADWMSVPLLQMEYGGRHIDRVGLAHASIAPYGAFAAADGRLVVVAVQNEREWVRFASQVLMSPDLASDPRFLDNALRVEHRHELTEVIKGAFRALDYGAIESRLLAAEIAFGAVNTVEGLAGHPQLKRIPIATAEGVVFAPAPPAGGRPLGPVPTLGGDTEAIRLKFSAVGQK